ncbi:MAG: OmpA family protein, partial [Gemmatimonadetes bacterium]|nr:OmpA family protein [Gemmatimonadota bacterium]
MRRATPIVLGIVVLVIAAACGEPNADSLAAAEATRRAAEQAARDSIERARLAADERIRRAAEDSLAALRRTTEEVRGMLAAMINFDFDRSDIRPGDAQILDQKLGILNANPNLQIEIAGHCDERGSDEYNLALGNRRAVAAKQYLVSHGIDASRIDTNVSAGRLRLAAAATPRRSPSLDLFVGGEREVVA